MQSSLNPRSNSLLDALPADERRQVLDQCTAVDHECGDVLNEPGETLRHVHFPLDCIITIHVTEDGHDRLEVGMVGNEGFYGAPIALGVSKSPLRATVQGSGTSFRMKAAEFDEALQMCPSLRPQVNRYIHVIMSQLAQTAYCAGYHVLEARVARWLLMTHDRSSGDEFRLTHELLAEMLGVRRSGVSIAASSLQERRLISYNRGQIVVTDRLGLERAACGCYVLSEDMYRAVFIPPESSKGE